MKTNTNVHEKVNLDISGAVHKDIILLKSRASSGTCVYMENYPARLTEVSGHTKLDLG